MFYQLPLVVALLSSLCLAEALTPAELEALAAPLPKTDPGSLEPQEIPKWARASFEESIRTLGADTTIGKDPADEKPSLGSRFDYAANNFAKIKDRKKAMAVFTFEKNLAYEIKRLKNKMDEMAKMAMQLSTEPSYHESLMQWWGGRKYQLENRLSQQAESNTLSYHGLMKFVIAESEQLDKEYASIQKELEKELKKPQAQPPTSRHLGAPAGSHGAPRR